MHPILLQFGPVTLHTYGLFMALAFVGAYHVSKYVFQTEKLPVHWLDQITLWLMIGGIVGARIMYFVSVDFAALKADPLSFFRIWEGGLVLYGGVLVGMVTMWLFSLRYGMPYLGLTDLFAFPLLLGQAIGRLGCFSAGCCYGKPSNVPWSVEFTSPDSLAPLFVSLHPTQLYDAIGTFLLFLMAVALWRFRVRRGALTAFYLIAQGTSRYFLEFYRGDDRGQFIWLFSPSQLVAISLVISGIGVLIYANSKKQS